MCRISIPWLADILSKYLPREVDKDLMTARFHNDLWDAGWVIVDREEAESYGLSISED
jgi:hypothetical protein